MLMSLCLRRGDVFGSLAACRPIRRGVCRESRAAAVRAVWTVGAANWPPKDALSGTLRTLLRVSGHVTALSATLKPARLRKWGLFPGCTEGRFWLGAH